MKRYVCMAFALSCLSARGQDMVVTMKGDTLLGVARIFTYDIIDRVQLANEKKTEFTAIQIREARVRGEIYHPVRVETGYVLMKLLTPGFVSLYMAHQPKGYLFDTQYLVKKTGEAMEVPNIGFKKMMAEFLEECAYVRDQIRRGELTRRDLNKILVDFNSCTDKISKGQPVAEQPATEGRLTPLTDLQAKLEADSSLANQKDALDILRDIIGKVRKSEPVPNYLVEGLKDQLKDLPAYKEDLEKAIAAAKGQ